MRGRGKEGRGGEGEGGVKGERREKVWVQWMNLYFLWKCQVHTHIHCTTLNGPGLPPPFLHTASYQNLDGGKAWERGL